MSLQVFLYSENDKFLSKQEPSYSKLYLSFGFLGLSELFNAFVLKYLASAMSEVDSGIGTE